MEKFDLRLDDLRIEGSSRAGDRTWFRVHPPGLAFDVGRGALELTGSREIFLTHGHLDHALGLPFVLSNRAMQGLGRTRVFCPAAIVGSLERFVAATRELEGGEYDWEVRGLGPGDRIEVGRDLWVEAFPVEHGVPALGYHLVRGRKRLAAAFRGRSGADLAALRREGVEIEELHEELWLTFCGDTGAGVFDHEPRLFSSRVLLLECTFLDPAEEAGAADYGHLHFRDLERVAERFENEVVVLHHLTRRHDPGELRRQVESRLPDLAERVRVVA